MPFSQTFPNGQTLTSTALTAEDFTSLLQKATCACLGLMNTQSFSVTLNANSNLVTLPSTIGVQVFFKVASADGSIPANTTITNVDSDTGVITLSNEATVTENTIIFITNPLAGKLVRQEWPKVGAPAWPKNDNIVFIRAVEEDDWYNKVRDQGVDDSNPTGYGYGSGAYGSGGYGGVTVPTTAALLTEYTRVWRVYWVFYGPDSYTRATLVKSAMQLDFIHDTLAASQVYLMPEVGAPKRQPENDISGEWWQRTDFEMVFYEQVNESIVLNTVASTEIIVMNANGIQLDFEVGE